MLFRNIGERGATAGITRNVSQATQEVTAHIAGVSAAANGTGAAADLVLRATSNLSKQAAQLSSEVTTFMAGARAV
jgi:methyl-accepting chemotaxis protein